MAGLTKFAFVALLLLLVPVSGFAQDPTIVTHWRGNVSIGTNTSTSGAVVGLYINNGTYAKQVTVGQLPGQNWSNGYSADVECASGNTMFLKVWAINATAISCVPQNLTYTNLSVSLVSSGGSCSYTQACSSGVCCSGSTEINNGITVGTCSASCSSSSGSSNSGGGSSSSGGGGGGGGSALPSESSTQFTVSGGTEQPLTFTKSADIAVQEIVLETASDASISKGQVTVKETTVGSSTSSTIEAGSTTVYKYLSITKTNIAEKDLAKAKIKFEVPASWFTVNNVDPKTVKLNRYVDNQWVALSTVLASSEGDKYVYEAETPGFSIFAISGEKLPEKPTAFDIIDEIRAFYAGTSTQTAFGIIDMIRSFYG